MMRSAEWFTLHDLAARLHVRPKTAWRRVRQYREACHLARNGAHPRLVLWIPAEVVAEIEQDQERRRRPVGHAFHMKR